MLEGVPLFVLNLAGWPVALEVQPAALARAIQARYVAFAAADVDAGQTILLQASVTLRGDERASPMLDTGLVSTPTGCLFAAPGYRGEIDVESGRGHLELSSQQPMEDIEYFLRVLYALLAYSEGGLLLHAAGVVSGGRAYLFIGRSGDGKSTIASLSVGKAVLNDDLVLVRPEGNGWSTWGTPFWNAGTGDRPGQTAGGPLAGIYSLVKDTRVFLAPLSPAAAVAELVSNCPVVNGDAWRLSGLLERCRALASAVVVQGLHFRKDTEFWRLLLPAAQ